MSEFDYKYNCQARFNRRGAIIPLFAISLPVILILIGLAVNLAFLELSRTELQVATDASVRAASRVFAQTGSLESAISQAQQLANANLVAGRTLALEASQFTTGQSHRPSLASRYNFTPANSNTNALQLEIRDFNVNTLFPMLGGASAARLNSVAIGTQLEIDIALVIDRSGSMAYADNEVAAYPPNPAAAPPGWTFGMPVPMPSRWLDTCDAVYAFLNQLQMTPLSEQVAMITYANDSLRDNNLTNNYNAVLASLDTYSNSFNLGGTNISSGIDEAVNALSAGGSRPWAAKVIIVMTDGIYNMGYDPYWAAQNAKQQGIMVFTVTFAAEANQTKMVEVAAVGGGQHFHAATGSDLSEIFRTVAKKLPTLISK